MSAQPLQPGSWVNGKYGPADHPTVVPDPSDLFLADSLCMTAGTLFIRAVTASEAGRDREAAEFVAAARAALGKALIASSPITVSLAATPTEWFAVASEITTQQPMGRAA